MSAPLAWSAGFSLGLSLIVAIGAQNAFVLRQGLRGEHVAVVVAVCALSDALLIAAGVAGAGVLVDRAAWLSPAMRIAGAVFLIGYAVLAARRALRPGRLEVRDAAPARRWAVVGTCLALTWLNPHVYLDTVVLLGSIASSYETHTWWFAAGAATGSLAWFAALGFGSRHLRPVFARPGAWRVLDGVIALVMSVLAVSLAASA